MPKYEYLRNIRLPIAPSFTTYSVTIIVARYYLGHVCTRRVLPCGKTSAATKEQKCLASSGA